MKKENFLSNKRIVCIINPYAANNKWIRNRLIRNYIKKNIPGKIIALHKNKHYTIQTAKRLCRNFDTIIVAGGDGTIADVIQGIMDSGRNKHISLGVIPLGSGNAFSISLKIPLSIRKALKIIKKGVSKEIDLIKINNKYASFGSVGATAQVLVEKLKNKIPGFLGHILSARIMLRLSRKKQEIELFDGVDDKGIHFDRKHLKLKVFDGFIGKSKHFGYGWMIAPKAKIDDGYIDMTFLEISNLRFLLFFPYIFFGIFQKTQKHFKAKKIIIKGNKLPVQYNGEWLGKTDTVRINILPKALKVLTPLGYRK
ncbi:MAG: diacylglycerol kinase family protein [Candidatus Aminicenantes bacterium]